MASSGTLPASKMTPKYEIKLLMHPNIVLDTKNKPTPAILKAFEITAPATKMNVQFLDTQEKDIYKRGWSPRIRKIQGQPVFDLTYKRRYRIADGEIDAALETAQRDGFESESTSYESQVDWGYNNQTLSLNHDTLYSESGNNAMELPCEEYSRKMLIKKAPNSFEHSIDKNWIINKLQESRIYGPVLAERYSGYWNKEETDIEVWPIKDAGGTRTEYIVEASFKVKKREKALEKRSELIEFLTTEDWFLPEDSLRTSLIMERY
jgi:hypothetical protein